MQIYVHTWKPAVIQLFSCLHCWHVTGRAQFSDFGVVNKSQEMLSIITQGQQFRHSMTITSSFCASSAIAA